MSLSAVIRRNRTKSTQKVVKGKIQVAAVLEKRYISEFKFDLKHGNWKMLPEIIKKTCFKKIQVKM